ncbi:hypothetical protein TSUD_350220 [Trifolium subterraneum]|uniref:Uncharacterized protein n=1 Tax=Trifolium subterraneum TaxID=3900 RepID=A0A2Z6NEY9_TRISU|nr:hypothetical protein TSUD_350220 [Trifolium subterraneum]
MAGFLFFIIDGRTVGMPVFFDSDLVFRRCFGDFGLGYVQPVVVVAVFLGWMNNDRFCVVSV